jgi:cytochrome P450
VPKLFASMCGAVMNEELRLIPPVIGIPKSTPKDSPQGLQMGGNHYTVPADCHITLNTAALHRNPKYWPHTSEEDLLDFRPERWMETGHHSETHHTQTDADEEGMDFEGPDKRPDTAPSMFRPAKGAYVPFSEGYRSCLGRRFAQVEILAVLAVMFKTWTVELDITMFLQEGESEERLSEAKKREYWGMANAQAKDLLRNGMGTIITIQMRKGKVPVKFIRRDAKR